MEWMRRKRNDIKTCAELFFMLSDDIQDMELSEALKSLMALFMEQIKGCVSDITEIIQSKVNKWIASQALYIQALFRDIRWES
jgi:hypothetical protein